MDAAIVREVLRRYDRSRHQRPCSPPHRDDPSQTAAVDSLFSAEPIWIVKTVLLEAAWVLRGRYGFENEGFVVAVENLLGLGNIVFEDESSVVDALVLIRHGVGAADAMRLTSRPSGTTFVSFDRSLVRRAQRAGVMTLRFQVSRVFPSPDPQSLTPLS